MDQPLPHFPQAVSLPPQVHFSPAVYSPSVYMNVGNDTISLASSTSGWLGYMGPKGNTVQGMQMEATSAVIPTSYGTSFYSLTICIFFQYSLGI
jgi:hypothetical protein